MLEAKVNRKKAPGLQIPKEVLLGSYHRLQLDNGVSLYYTENPDDLLVKLELCFPAGRWFETQKMMSRAVCRLLTKGTSLHNAKELANQIEFYGAQVDTANGHDTTSVKILCLEKHLAHILPLVQEMLADAIFPQDELVRFKQKQVQKWQVGLQNTDFVANRAFHEAVFGIDHPYGYKVDQVHIEALETESLRTFARSHYQLPLATIFASGRLTSQTLSTINQYLGAGKAAHNAVSVPNHELTGNPQNLELEHHQSVQTSIRLGQLSLGKDHPDYPAFYVANTVLGGYFGSRLMSNIREDKGYTYGIYSMVQHHRNASFLVIDTEVGNEVCRHAVEEIYKEMRLLGQQPVSEEELMVVRNYMMGSLIRSTDGPNNRIQIIRNMVLSGLDFDYFNRLVQAVADTTPEKICEMAANYLNPDKQTLILCGKPS